MPYQITEPHPTATPNTYSHTGRGGFGNRFKVKSSFSSSPNGSLIKTASFSSTTSTGCVSTGRGGAANIRTADTVKHFSLDEEMTLQAREAHHAVWYVGRGGAGNWGGAKGRDAAGRKMSEESGSSENIVGESTKSGIWGRLSGVFDRN